MCASGFVAAAYAGGAWREVALYQRGDLRPGDTVPGPAIIAEANGTTVVDEGWSARVNELGHLLLARVAPRPGGRAVGTAADLKQLATA